jgi:hypothetical protein
VRKSGDIIVLLFSKKRKKRRKKEEKDKKVRLTQALTHNHGII